MNKIKVVTFVSGHNFYFIKFSVKLKAIHVICKIHNCLAASEGDMQFPGLEIFQF